MRVRSNIGDVNKRLSDVAQGLKDKRGLSKFAALIAVRGVQRNFDEHRDSLGRWWPALKNRPGGVPFKTGRQRMKRGITSRQTENGFLVGAGTETAAFNAVHNFGSKLWWKTRGKKGNPQRQFMYLSKAAQKELVRECMAFVKRIWGK